MGEQAYNKLIGKMASALEDDFQGSINGRVRCFFFERVTDATLKDLLAARREILPTLMKIAAQEEMVCKDWILPKFSLHVMTSMYRDLRVQNQSRMDCMRAAALQSNSAITALKDSLKIIEYVEKDPIYLDPH